jgi:hypothetical protein
MEHGYPVRPIAPSSDPLVPANFGAWFEKVAEVTRRSFAPLLAIQVGAAIINTIFGISVFRPFGALDSGGSSPESVLGLGLISVVVVLIVSVLTQGASIFVVIRDASGEPASMGAVLAFAVGRALPLLGWEIVAGILMLVGFVLFIIPGIYLVIVFAATLTGVVVVESKNIGRCFALVRRRFWPTAGRLLLAFLIAIIYSVVISVIVSAAASPDSIVGTVLYAILILPLEIALVAVSVVTYAELRFHENPEVLTPVLAAELRR